jgi:hypothetical protein
MKDPHGALSSNRLDFVIGHERTAPSIIIILFRLRFRVKNNPTQALSSDHRGFCFRVMNDLLQALSSDSLDLLSGDERLAPSSVFGPFEFVIDSRTRPAPSFAFAPFYYKVAFFRVTTVQLQALSSDRLVSREPRKSSTPSFIFLTAW